MKNGAKHTTSKAAKSKRLGWPSIRKDKAVRLSEDMVKSRDVAVKQSAATKTADKNTFLVP